LAETAVARGRTPFVVVLTDGRANIAADGRAVRSIAESDAAAAARRSGRPGSHRPSSISRRARDRKARRSPPPWVRAICRCRAPMPPRCTLRSSQAQRA
jgi:hypothetical protein